MSNALSLKQILITLESIAERHYLINSFWVGDDHDLNAAGGIVYPIFQVKPEIARLPQNNYGEYKEILLTLKCKVIDRELQDGSNTNDVHSDTLRIAQDIINEINQHPFYQNSNISLDGDIFIGELSEWNDDYTAGWEFDLGLKILNKNNFCGLPIESIPGYSIAGPTDDNYNISWGYLTCETVTGCTNLTNFINTIIGDSLSSSTITYIQPGTNTFTGGTYQYPTVNITGGTVNNWNVTGGTLSSGGTDLYNIFVTTLDGNDITRVQPGLNIYTGGTPNNPTVNISAATLTYLSATSISADTFYSGSTPLSSIIINAVTATTSALTSTRVQNGTNTFTGGTADLPTVNITGGTVNNWNITGGTLASGGTDLYSIFVTALDGNDITRVQPGTNTYTGGTANNPTVNVSALTINNLTVSGQTLLGTVSASTFSGGTYLSGGTNLYDIFQGAGTDTNHTAVQNGLNTYTGGTANLPTVNISAATLTYLSATSISAATFYSGSTPLSSIIINTVTGATSGITGSINVNGLNTYTGGTTALQSINISAATLDNLSVSGNSILSATSASTLSILNSGATIIVYNDYSGNRINTGVSFSTIVGGTGNTINAASSNVNIIGGYKISGTNDNHTYTSNLVVTGTSNGNLYATNYFSGSTPLQTVITNMLDGNDVTRVQPGTNTYTGGTDNLPTVNISAATLSYLSATTISGTNIFSGSVNLNSIFLSTGTTLGEVNTASSVGTGNSIFKQKTGVDLEFRSLSAGTNITITTGDTITINSSGGGSAANATLPFNIGVSASDETTTLSTGNAKITFLTPRTGSLTKIVAGLTTTGSTTTTVRVNKNGTVVSTSNIDLGNAVSSNSITTPTLTATTFTAWDTYTVDITAAGTGAKGLKVYFEGSYYNPFTASTTTIPWELGLAISDETSQIVTGNTSVTMLMPFSGTITGVTVSLSTSGSTGSEFNIKDNGDTLFTTRPTIDANEFTTITAANPSVITATTIGQYDTLVFSILSAGTGAAGAKVWLTGTRNI